MPVKRESACKTLSQVLAHSVQSMLAITTRTTSYHSLLKLTVLE